MERIGLMVHGSRRDAVACAAKATRFLQRAGIKVQAEEASAPCRAGRTPLP